MDFDDLNFKNRPFRQIPAYAQSKLANVLFTKALARKLAEHGIEGVNIYSLHPGVIHTQLGRNVNVLFPGLSLITRLFNRWLIKTPEQGAQTTIYCAVDEQAGRETGLYYSDCKEKKPSNKALNEKDADKLWDVSVQLTGLEDYDPFKKEN